MKKIDKKNEIINEAIRFLEKRNSIIVSTINKQGYIHNSVKGIVSAKKHGTVFLTDLYYNNTYKNLKRNSVISLTAVDEHSFKGYCLEGKAQIIERKNVEPHVLEEWENRLNSRISERLIQGVKRGIKTEKHYEIHLPKDLKYLIKVEIKNVIDLTPPSLK